MPVTIDHAGQSSKRPKLNSASESDTYLTGRAFSFLLHVHVWGGPIRRVSDQGYKHLVTMTSLQHVSHWSDSAAGSAL
jgi:hypothetical protein